MERDNHNTDLGEVTDPDGEITLPSSRALVHTRGMNTRSTIAWLRAEHGPDGAARVRDALPRSVVDALGGREGRPFLVLISCSSL